MAADAKLKDKSVTLDSSSQKNPQNQTLAKLPADFPTDIPLYPQAKLQEVNQVSPQGQTTRWTTEDPSNIVQNFYQKAFPSRGWQLSQPSDSSFSNAPTDILVARQSNLKVTVSIKTGSAAIATTTTTPQPSASTPTQSLNSTTEFTIQYIRETDAASPQQSDPDFIGPPLPSVGSSLKPSPNQPSTTPVESSVFTDLNKAPTESRQYIEQLAALGVLTQKSAGSKSNQTATSTQFEPNKTITRREYARWLVATNNQIYSLRQAKQIRLGLQTSQPAFQDISRTDPDFPAIQGLAEAGLIPSPLTGDATEVLFRPEAPLTRENLILWKVPLDSRQTLPNASIDAVKQTWGFQDASKIDPKALRAVLADFQNGEMANIRRVLGYTTLFQPKKPVTRAEAAVVLWYFGAQGEGISAKEALQQKSQPQPSATPEATPSSSPSQ